jgi:mono/diheme cytochrome c family protein
MKCDNRRLRLWFSAGTLLGLALYVCCSSAFSAPAPAGAETFKAKCAMCHGDDASGNTPLGKRLKIHDLRSPEVQKETDDQLAAIITDGKPPMPAYSKILTVEQIHQLVAYLRSIATNS